MSSLSRTRLSEAMARRIRVSVYGRLVLLVLCILLPMLSLMGIIIRERFTERVQGELSSSLDYSNAISTAFANYLNALWGAEAALGNAIALEGAGLSPDQAERLMQAQLAVHPTVASFAWVSPDGYVLASTRSGSRGVYGGDREYFQQIVSGDESAVSDLLIGRVSNELTIAVARGIRRNGKLVGVLSAGVDITKLEKVLPAAPRGIRTFALVDRQATVVYWSGSPLLTLEQRRLRADSPARTALGGREVTSTGYTSSIDGSRQMSSNVPIPRIGWVAYAAAPVNEVLASAWHGTTQTVMTASLVILFSLAGAWLISVSLVSPIRELHRAAKAISRGELSARVTLVGRDELGTMAHAFNQMADEIQALARERDRREAQLHQLAERDHVTGLYNHRAFQAKLRQALAVREETSGALSLLMIDADHFKAYNDTYGHIEGDRALRHLAAILEKNSRVGDMVCRYGGEEFAVILPECESNLARQIAERLRAAVATFNFAVEGDKEAHLTVSIGGASCPSDAPDLVARADAALYRAKHQGRNRVEMHFC